MGTEIETNRVESNHLQEKVNVKKHPYKSLKNEYMASLVPMKKLAINIDEPLRSLILSQPDELPLSEFQIKFLEWFKLTKLIGKEYR